MRKIFLFAILALLLFVGAIFSPDILRGYGVKYALAEDPDIEALLKDYTGKYIKSSKTQKATKRETFSETTKRYIYEKPTVKNFSYLFWAVGFYKPSNDQAIDEFMRINECSIYKNYNSDEIEWADIRDATRDFLRDNRSDFPTRFEFIIPLKLNEYDEDKEAFNIQKEYEIKSLRRFELGASDINKTYCQGKGNKRRNYPRIIVLEFSRPFDLVDIPMEKDTAADYMKRKKKQFNSMYSEEHRRRERALELRDAYLFIKVKIFSYGKILGVNYTGHKIVQMMGVLEGFEIYETMKKENLFYAQNYVTARSKSKVNKKLKEQYQILLEKHKGDGVLHP